MVDRFWTKVDKRGPDECWEWTGARGGAIGHGSFWDGTRTVGAHRVSWEMAFGPIPDGEGYHGTCICHRCDNPPCVNPAHLFLGTHRENMGDGRSKGRFSALRGAGNPNNRLTEDDVREIRRRHAAGESQRSIARSYGLHPSSVNRIFNGSAWSWVGAA